MTTIEDALPQIVDDLHNLDSPWALVGGLAVCARAEPRPTAVRLLAPIVGGDVAIDLFFASSGIEAEVVAAAEPLEVPPSLTVPVARTGHLIAVKLLWRRSDKRDRDLRTLIEHADTADLEDARQLIGLITERGYHRGRDLGSALDSWLGNSTVR